MKAYDRILRADLDFGLFRCASHCREKEQINVEITHESIQRKLCVINLCFPEKIYSFIFCILDRCV